MAWKESTRLILFNNHDELWVLASKLQTEIGDPVAQDDLVVGGTVIYKSRGKPYTAEILDVKCMCMIDGMQCTGMCLSVYLCCLQPLTLSS